jgi:Icc-related predicted phosphoesterase
MENVHTLDQPLRRLLFVSDIHAEEDREALSDLERVLQDLKPDVVLFGGDVGSYEDFVRLTELCEKYSRKTYYILGNNDDFDILKTEGNVTALDIGLHIHALHSYYGYDLVLTGISRNIGLRKSKHRLTPEEYIERATRLGQLLNYFRAALKQIFTVLVIHEVPLEICELAVKRGVIQSYNRKIVETVSKAVEFIGPNLVLHGHLHVDYIRYTRAEMPRREILCATWTRHRRCVLIELERGRVVVEVLEMTRTVDKFEIEVS